MRSHPLCDLRVSSPLAVHLFEASVQPPKYRCFSCIPEGSHATMSAAGGASGLRTLPCCTWGSLLEASTFCVVRTASMGKNPRLQWNLIP